MKNIELLFEYNRNRQIKSCKRNIKLKTENKFKFWRFTNNECVFSGDNRQVVISFNAQKSIWTDGIRYSSINFLNENYNKFNNKFRSDLQLKHFRQVIDYSHSKTDYLNRISTNILFFFKHLGLEDSTIEILCEGIIEIVGNAIEHGHSDCLVDIDVTDEEYQKRDDSEDSLYYGVNVVVLNFSDKTFHDKLKQKLSNADNLNERYVKVNEAKKFHSQHFNQEYTESDFYTIAAFQHKISGSRHKDSTGGVGLTHLIKSLEEKSSGHICYVLCQNRALYFSKELLQYDSNDYIGFNNENDFFKHTPEPSILKISYTYFPGTAYNLNFAIKKGEIENG